MDLTILLEHNYNKKKNKNWILIDNYTIKYTYDFSEKRYSNNSQFSLFLDKIRRDANIIYCFIQDLNLGFSKKLKITSISLTYATKVSHSNNSIIYDTFLEGLYLSNYNFGRYKTNSQSNLLKIKTKCKNIINESSILGNYITRDLVNEPLSYLTAVKLSSIIKKLGKEVGFSVKVLNEKSIKSLKMGGVLSVNKGSIAKPTFNILTYKPKRAINRKPYVLVGKGVMFDTGGLSLKPTPNSMDMMKCDMGGAATVVGTIYALARAKANCYVIGLIPAVENRPGGEAYVPGDVVKMMSGATVEVLNTDAEGRLILADALHYAKRYKPALVIDIATLTGAAARSIGKYGVVAMERELDSGGSGMNSTQMNKLVATGYEKGERVAVQPFWDDYNSELQSSVADITNLGGAEAGHITAGKFLEHFIGYPWIHLDIAGAAFLKQDYLYYKKGATGIGVLLLSHFLHRLSVQDAK